MNQHGTNPAPGVDFDVVVLGELNVDVILRTDQAPQFGQVELQVPDGAITLGSSGAITAAALAALGLRVAYCGLLGADRIGDLVLAELGELGVDVTAVTRTSDRATGFTVVLAAPDGDRAMMTYPGTMDQFGVDDIPAGLLERCAHVHISSIHLQNALAPGLPALLRGRPEGVTVSLDPGWDPSQRWTAVGPVLGLIDYLLPNENECLAMGAPAADVESAAAALAIQGPTVVTKLGAAGAMSVSPSGRIDRMSGPVRVPVDTTGAGDNFDAGFLAALLGAFGPVGPREMLAAGCATGAISTSGLGGTGALATAIQARELAEQILTGASGATTSRFDLSTIDGPHPAAAQDLEYR